MASRPAPLAAPAPPDAAAEAPEEPGMAAWKKLLIACGGSVVTALTVLGMFTVYCGFQLVNGNMTPEDVARYAGLAQEKWVWLTSSGGTWFAAIATRYLLPAYLQLRREWAEIREARVAERVAKLMGKA